MRTKIKTVGGKQTWGVPWSQSAVQRKLVVTVGSSARQKGLRRRPPKKEAWEPNRRSEDEKAGERAKSLSKHL